MLIDTRHDTTDTRLEHLPEYLDRTYIVHTIEMIAKIEQHRLKK